MRGYKGGSLGGTYGRKPSPGLGRGGPQTRGRSPGKGQTRRRSPGREQPPPPSGGPLDWDSIVKDGETRRQHVAKHESDDTAKPVHGIFNGSSETITNDAWSKRTSAMAHSVGSTTQYRIPYPNAGRQGGSIEAERIKRGEAPSSPLNQVTVVTQKDTSKLITAFPSK